MFVLRSSCSVQSVLFTDTDPVELDFLMLLMYYSQTAEYRLLKQP